MNWYITGDIHGATIDLKYRSKYMTSPSAMIVLGDFGANYYLNKNDRKFKQTAAQELETLFYVIEGNHEANPENLGFDEVYDENVGGVVYIEKEFPNIRYFKRYGIYTINGYKCLVIGGAYSVDKFYRLMNGWRWFEDEQLSEEERKLCMKMAAGQHFDFVFTHTCPYKYRPTDLFLSQVDQNTVDNTMEYFLEDIEAYITYDAWCWGHYHDSRVEAPHCEMFYKAVDLLSEVKERWDDYEQGKELPFDLHKSPNFF